MQAELLTGDAAYEQLTSGLPPIFTSGLPPIWETIRVHCDLSALKRPLGLWANLQNLPVLATLKSRPEIPLSRSEILEGPDCLA